jgi:hypothetical protein
MFGTIPNFPSMALNNSLVFPVAVSVGKAFKRVILSLFVFVEIDSTKMGLGKGRENG